MSNTGITFDWNKAIEQIVDNKLDVIYLILFIFVLFLIWIFIYIRFIKKAVDKQDMEIIKIKTKNIRTTSWDVIIWKWNTKNK